MVKPYKTLSLDIETYSPADLSASGVYPYAEDGDFEILLLGYAFEDEEVRVVDLKSGEELPREVREALTDPNILKTAFNANFERTCLSSYLKAEMPTEEWSCTQVMALGQGLPGSLEEVGECLGLKEQKLKEGSRLIKYFSLPQKPNLLNGHRQRNLPGDHFEKWEEFKAYCKRDVEVERGIRKKLENYTETNMEKRLWCLDQRINDRGVRVDEIFINQAILCDSSHKNKLLMEAKDLTGLENPNSLSQLKKWLLDNKGIEAKSLSKEALEELLEKTKDEKVKRVLEIRRELSKTSIKKYEAMEKALCLDGRIRGLLKFYGASRTGRWAGRLVQVQNLPQSNIENLELARKLLREGSFDKIGTQIGSVPEVLSGLIRTSFIPGFGSRFIVSDFSAIEARVIAWLAGEHWRMEVFRSHGKIYEASASRMFGVPMENIDKSSPLRQKGKIAELALGYQGGTGALLSMGALKMGLSEDELPELVNAWRESNPHIVKLWRDVERAAVRAVKNRAYERLYGGIEFFLEGSSLMVGLPSGRCLSYRNPIIEKDEGFMKDTLTYEGTLQATKKWGRLKTYGGKLVENIVQAIARDCLGIAMLRLNDAGYDIVMHVHDEVVLEAPKGFGSLEEVESIMTKPIPWAEGLVLGAEGWEGEYYRK